MRDFVKKNTIYMTLAGSYMYGTNIESSDVDKRGICVPPKEVILGFTNPFEQQNVPDEEDTIIYGLQKFMRLAAACNPNILELLFAPEECVEICEWPWPILRQNRDKFLCAEAYKKFSGYAMGQLKRIRSHRQWLLHPPTHKPVRSEFGLPEQPSGVLGLAKGVDLSEIDPQALRVVEAEKRYKAKLREWNQYCTWKKDRNPQRAELEASFGYDTKHAMHLVRLLRMGDEILTKGTLTVRRPDAEELLEIRAGKWSYDQLMEQVDPLVEKLDHVYQEKKYVVPTKVKLQELSNLCCTLHEMYWEQYD